MRWLPSFSDQLQPAREVLRWLCVLTPMAAAIGSACAFFLWALDQATQTRFDHPWLLWLLPLSGVGIVLLYQKLGKTSEQGNNLILDAIHTPGGGVPRRMAPLVLFGTLMTHLFGGSAGREGTAIQMGGSIASGYARLWGRFNEQERKTLLTAGIAAGFAGVFGTPIAGTIFALEVLTAGQIRYRPMIPCLIAAIIADWTCHAWQIEHVMYRFDLLTNPDGIPPMDPLLLAKCAAAAALFGLCAWGFVSFTHGLTAVLGKRIPNACLRAALGGIAIIALTLILGTRAYLGLGITSPDPSDVTILSAFTPEGADFWSWFWKLLFTGITLASGFKGGEVTPLFFIGATLGNTLAWLMGAPVELFAAIGFVAVFAGATNTPLACTIMAIELFGPWHVGYFAVGCFGAYLFSGHRSVYHTQRVDTPKHEGFQHPPTGHVNDKKQPPDTR